MPHNHEIEPQIHGFAEMIRSRSISAIWLVAHLLAPVDKKELHDALFATGNFRDRRYVAESTRLSRIAINSYATDLWGKVLIIGDSANESYSLNGSLVEEFEQLYHALLPTTTESIRVTTIKSDDTYPENLPRLHRHTHASLDNHGDIGSKDRESEFIDAYKLYCSEINKLPVLEIEEEKALAIQVQEGLRAQRALETQTNADSDTRYSLKQIISIGKLAEKQLILANLRLVRMFARKYSRSGIPILDLIQEGNIGLMKAVQNYDPTKNFRFATYAGWSIRNEIVRSIPRLRYGKELSRREHELAKNIEQTIVRYLQSHNRSPSIEEIADELVVDPSKVLEVTEKSERILSLDASYGVDSDTKLSDLVHDPTSVSVEEVALSNITLEEICGIIDSFPTIQRDVIRCRCGIASGTPQSLTTTSQNLGLSRDIVRTVDKNAMRALKEKTSSYLSDV